ncbi:MAG: stage III sporulation AC/AD family protein [Oliverpabstia sp.]|nr:stage III sporulation AC/AD family protein [Lachnospiraceae bacterium]MDY5026685.1 stage III sporulation AC/AD family protein [Oliverpabstia sp.]
MEIIRISVVGIAGVFLAILLKQVRPEYSLYITMAAGIAILFYSAGKLSYLLSSLRKIQQYVPVDAAYMTILLKMIGITYIGQFCAGICKDAGYSAVAGQIEIFGRLAVLAVSMPVLTALLETIHEFLA